MVEPPEVSIVVPNFNGRTVLPHCLDSLEKQTCRSFETIVVDNGSWDGSVPYLQNRPGLRLLALPSNRGFAGGCNAGIRESRGRFIALLNNDAEAAPDWLEKLLDAAGDHPGADSFASMILRRNEGDTIDSAGDVYTIAGSAKKRGERQPRSSIFSRRRVVFGASACAGFYRRRYFDVAGCFDEDFFCYFEDVDLCFRAVLYGLTCLFVPDAVVYHRVSATKGEKSPFVTYHNSRNLEWVYLKNMPGRLMLKYLLPTVTLRLMAWAYWQKRRQGRTFLKAKWDAYRALGSVWIKRKQIQSKRVRTPSQVDRLLEKHWIRAHLQGRR
ncbi:MAG: glycosyltransferase family 2 protein [Deltaproteobacteria bacterium]|nr:glycosyltransferase family 2 protein [Deltaproteobacteria bacterium]